MENQRFEELLVKDLVGDITAGEREELVEMLQSNEGLRKEHGLLKDFWERQDLSFTDSHSIFERIQDEIRRREEQFGAAPEVSSAEVERAMLADGERVMLTQGAAGKGIRRRGVRRMWRSMTAAAVVVLMLGGFGAYHYFYKRGPAREGLVWQEKYTAKSAQSGLVLADGSTVALNVDSRLRYPVSFGGPTREVYLTGEAFFTIQKDPGHPFIIHTDKMTIRVLGTAFNVRCYPGDDVTETTLLQGSVEVTFPDRPADKIILKPTDKLVIRNEAAGAVAGDPGGSKKGSPSPGAAVTKYALTALTYYPARPNTIVETSWLDKKLVFDGEELQSVARRMERWFGVTIVIDNPALKHLPFTGLFEKEKIGEAMYALELSEKKIHYTIKDSVIHIF